MSAHTVRPEVDGFTLAHRDFAQHIADEFAQAGASTSAAAWRELHVRIERAIVGEWARFTQRDVDLCAALHLAVLRYPLADGARERSKILAQLGVVLELAKRGRLAQLAGRA